MPRRRGAALEDVARRQASLRTVFGEGPDGVPFQRVEEMPAIAFETADLGRTACSERDDAVRERLAALQSRPFDLLQGPPWRVALLGLDARTHVLAVVMHHILSDGASMQLWVAEWLEAYGARRQGLPARGMPPLQYIDYAAWAAGRLEAGEGERQWAWWRERLAHWHAAPLRGAAGPSRARRGLPIQPAAMPSRCRRRWCRACARCRRARVRHPSWCCWRPCRCCCPGTRASRACASARRWRSGACPAWTGWSASS